MKRILPWVVLIALLAGLGAGLHVFLPPQPRWILSDNLLPLALSPDGSTLYTARTEQRPNTRAEASICLREMTNAYPFATR